MYLCFEEENSSYFQKLTNEVAVSIQITCFHNRNTVEISAYNGELKIDQTGDMHK